MMRLWKVMRRLLVILASFLGLCLLLVVCIQWLSPQGQEGYRNRTNSQQIKPGMSLPEVVAIMGLPIRQGPNGADSALVYSYVPPPGASEAVTIYFTADSTVSHVVNMD